MAIYDQSATCYLAMLTILLATTCFKYFSEVTDYHKLNQSVIDSSLLVVLVRLSIKPDVELMFFLFQCILCFDESYVAIHSTLYGKAPGYHPKR